MTTLPSQQLDSPKPNNPLPHLDGNSNSPDFFRAVNLHCLTSHGLIGQDVIKGRPTIPEKLGPRPHYSDQRLHPLTGDPIPDSRQFPRVDATKEQLATYGFDPDELPLTPDGERRLDSALAAYTHRQNSLATTKAALKINDDALLNIIMAAITPAAHNQYIISPEYLVWRDLPFESVSRSHYFLVLLETLFSKGNATASVEHATALFGGKQPHDQPHPSHYIKMTNERMDQFRHLLADPAHPGLVSFNRIHAMVIISGLNKTSSANREGIKAHLQAHPIDALDLPTELISSVLSAHMSDLNTDSISEQSAAYAAHHTAHATKGTPPAPFVSHKDNPDKSQIPGLAHCPNCHALTKKFFYGHDPRRCNRSKESEAEKQKAYLKKRHEARQLTAHAAVLSPPPPYAPPLTQAACHAFIHGGVPNPTYPGLTRAGCFSFLALHYPEDLDA